jgi:hypothetical protein
MYMFKPRDGKWQLYMFDLDWLMLVSPGRPGCLYGLHRSPVQFE